MTEVAQNKSQPEMSTSDKSLTNGTTVSGEKVESRVGYDQMTSKDYYFDSYAHFGIHEVCMYAIHIRAVYLKTCASSK